ncbi:MAG: alpha/beta hydrolase [Anaerolineae bacterium]|nr:alpha/beta hydrolase [Anaerolineae bacterium]
MPYVTVDGQRLFYQVDRDDSDNAHPPLVLVHGAGGTHLHWPPQLRHLVGFDVFAVDLPGHGRSEGTGRRSIAAYREVVQGLVRELGLEKFVLAGHSMGGAIAQDFALACPDALAGLVLVGSGARLRVAPSILAGLRTDFPATVRLIADWAYGASPSEHMLHLYVERLLDNDPHVVHGDFSACDAFDFMGQVSRIAAPALIICGEADRLTPPKYSQYLREQIPNAELHLFRDAGHMVMWEQATGVTRVIADFVKRLSTVKVSAEQAAA